MAVTHNHIIAFAPVNICCSEGERQQFRLFNPLGCLRQSAVDVFNKLLFADARKVAVMQHAVPALFVKGEFGRMFCKQSALFHPLKCSGDGEWIVENAEGVQHYWELARNESSADILGEARTYYHLLGSVRNFKLIFG